MYSYLVFIYLFYFFFIIIIIIIIFYFILFFWGQMAEGCHKPWVTPVMLVWSQIIILC